MDVRGKANMRKAILRRNSILIELDKKKKEIKKRKNRDRSKTTRKSLRKRIHLLQLNR